MSFIYSKILIVDFNNIHLFAFFCVELSENTEAKLNINSIPHLQFRRIVIAMRTEAQ